MVHSLIIFASGKGSNAQAIIDYFRYTNSVKVSLIVSNKPDAGVLDIAEREGIPALVINRQSFADEALAAQLEAYRPTLIILAGFLWKIPDYLTSAFRNKIINIHPALLPEFGGKGMYGMHVHQAVIAAGKKESGITIHYVDEVYDHGAIIMQARCSIGAGQRPEQLAASIHQLEHFYFPRTIEYLLQQATSASAPDTI